MNELGGKPIGRRVFFGLVGLGAAGVVFGAKVQNKLERWAAPIEARDFTGLLSLLPLGRFRYYTITGNFPHRDRSVYKLQVKGLVERPLTLSYAQLMAMPKTRLLRDFQCVTGWRVPNVHWTGVRLSEVLDRAGVKPGSDGIAIRVVRRRVPRASRSRRRAAPT